MDAEMLKNFENQLNQELEELSSRHKQMVHGMVGQENLYSDPLDRASAGADLEFLLRIKDREAKLMRKIKTALARIQDGTFGICDVCEEEISVARMQARPVAIHCIACKTKMEYQEIQMQKTAEIS